MFSFIHLISFLMSIQTYKATYYDASGRVFPATIFISTITLSIRFRDENGIEKDVYWLAESIESMEEDASGSAQLRYRNKEGNQERLLVRDQELLQAIKKNFKNQRFVGGVYYKTLGKTRNKILIFLSVILGLIALAYFWLVPMIGEKIAMNFSKETEIDLGNQMYESIKSSYTIDQRTTDALNEFYKELNYEVGYPVKITVVKSKDKNAFAIPGGNIVVFDSLLMAIKTPEQLAALLGHEASHIAYRHSLRQLFRGLASNMFLMLLVGNDSGIVTFLAENADALKSLGYSRSLETDADNKGMELMTTRGLDPGGMLGLMRILQGSVGDEEPNSILSSHPVFSARIKNIEEKVSQLKTGSKPDQRLNAIFEQLYP